MWEDLDILADSKLDSAGCRDLQSVWIRNVVGILPTVSLNQKCSWYINGVPLVYVIHRFSLPLFSCYKKRTSLTFLQFLVRCLSIKPFWAPNSLFGEIYTHDYPPSHPMTSLQLDFSILLIWKSHKTFKKILQIMKQFIITIQLKKIKNIRFFTHQLCVHEMIHGKREFYMVDILVPARSKETYKWFNLISFWWFHVRWWMVTASGIEVTQYHWNAKCNLPWTISCAAATVSQWLALKLKVGHCSLSYNHWKN